MLKKTSYLILMVLLFVCLCSVLTGCNADNVSDYIQKDSDYNMDYALDAGQYCMFVSKQINAIMNQSATTMDIAHSVAKNSYPADTARDSLQASLSIIVDAKQQIEYMFPPEQYRANYNNILRIIENIEARYKTMIDVLNDDAIDYNQLIQASELLSTDTSSLAAEANVYYK